MDDSEFDALTQEQQRVLAARFARHQRKVQAALKKRMREIAAFVRLHPDAVISMDVKDMVLGAGVMPRAVIHLEVDSERYRLFMAARANISRVINGQH